MRRCHKQSQLFLAHGGPCPLDTDWQAMTMGRTKSRKPTVPLKSKLKKDPGIPRLPDLKEKVRNAGKQRAPPVPTNRGSDPDSTMASEPTLSTLAQLATEAASVQQEEDPSSSSLPSSSKTKEQMRRHYLRTLHKVIDESDIIILVLDARDPEGCRSRLVEEEVRRREMEGKKLVFVLNKIDLIPRANAQAWLKHLRHSTPTLPFLSSASSHQRTNISSSTAPSLLKLLKVYKPKAGSVTVGIVGYPNVGKSSLINSLKRSKVCAVGALPGHTKELQFVHLERGMRFIDSPGVIFDDDDEASDVKGQKKGSVLLRNVVKVEDVEDPIAVVEEIIARTTQPALQKIYNLPEFSSTLEFLTMLAMNSGRLLKGGTPDINSAARQVLSDWNQQKVPYFSTPPAIHPSSIPSTVPTNTQDNADTPLIAPGAENVGQAQILNTFSKPFELEGLFGAADAGAFGNGADDVAMADEDGDVFWDAVEAMDEDGIQMNTDDSNTSFAPRGSRKRARSPSPAATNNTDPENARMMSTATPSHVRQPKRQRKSKDIPAYDALPEAHVLKGMGKSNPLNRRVLKREARKARRAGRARGKTGGEGEGGGAGGSMEVDDDGLAFKFIT